MCVLLATAPRDTFNGLAVGRKTCFEVEEAVRWGRFCFQALLEPDRLVTDGLKGADRTMHGCSIRPTAC